LRPAVETWASPIYVGIRLAPQDPLTLLVDLSRLAEARPKRYGGGPLGQAAITLATRFATPSRQTQNSAHSGGFPSSAVDPRDARNVMLAKVGVVGSNPIARSSIEYAKSRGKPAAFACRGIVAGR
jgi:hypothetical protein